MAYLYTHTRLDTNEIFYIGISTDKKYKRAYNKDLRSKYWKNLTKNREYRVDIILDNISWEEACQEEIRLIKLYGRRDLGTGTLVNTTDGGEGVPNPSKEVRKKISDRRKKKVSLYNTDKSLFKVFTSLLECAEFLKCSLSNLHIALSGGMMKVGGYYIEYGDAKILNKEFKRRIRNDRKIIYQYDLEGNFIDSYSHNQEASDKTGINRGNINSCCNNKIKTAGGYKFTYKQALKDLL